MTEEAWLACTDPQPMVEFLRGKVSDRKVRLLACTCCGRVTRLLSRYSRKALAVSERYADAEVSEEKLRLAWRDARRAAQVEYRRDRAAADGTAMCGRRSGVRGGRRSGTDGGRVGGEE
ncbi:MAG TPA: hypothetical protein VM533_21115 [Fimbriiglobus sp.]|nr:hypothetical protein [Fimbriiglobus sp.]